MSAMDGKPIRADMYVNDKIIGRATNQVGKQNFTISF